LHFGIGNTLVSVPRRKAILAVAALYQRSESRPVGWSTRDIIERSYDGSFAGLKYVTLLPAARHSSDATYREAAPRNHSDLADVVR
jgi:hypothetical protein